MLNILLVLSGLFIALAQAILAREFLVVTFGNELAIGFYFAAWFFWFGLGSYIYSKLSRKITEPVFWLSILIAVLPFLLLGGIITLRNYRSLFVIYSLQSLSLPLTLIAISLILAPFCFFAGIGFPLSMDLKIKKDKAQPALSYIFQVLGFMAGGVLFSAVFVRYFNSFAMAFIASTLLLAVLLLVRSRLGLKRYFIYIITGALALSVFFVAGSTVLNSYYNLSRWKSFGNGYELLKSRNSIYQNMAVAIKDGQYGIFENGRQALSFPEDYAEAQFIHPIMLQHRRPKKVLFIGVPTNSLIREMASYWVDSLDIAHTDPDISPMLSGVIDYKDTLRPLFINTEARTYLKGVKKKYDLIICDIPGSSTAFQNRYYTGEFFKEAGAALTGEGVFVTKLVFANNSFSKIASVFYTIKRVFPNCLVSAGETVFIYASEGNYLNMNEDVLSDRYKWRKIRSEYFSKYVFKTIFEKDRMKELNDRLENDRSEIYSSDLNTGAYLLGLWDWSGFSGAGLFTVLRLIFGPVCLIIYILAAFWYLYSKKSIMQTRLNISAFTSGFSAILFALLLLCLFQNLKGCAIGYLGYLSGFLALGLFAGVYAGAKFKNINKVRLALLHGLFIPLAILILSYVFILSTKDPGPGFVYGGLAVLLVFCGLITGGFYPVLLKLFQLPGRRVKAGFPVLLSYQNVGAGFGALVGLLFLLPFGGFLGTIICMVVINLLMGIIILKKAG